MFTYRGVSKGARSIQEMVRANPLVRSIKPVVNGNVFAPLETYTQYGDELGEIVEELASILHPEVFRKHKLKFFRRLPRKTREQE